MTIFYYLEQINGQHSFKEEGVATYFPELTELNSWYVESEGNVLTLLHSEWPKLHGVLVTLSAVGLIFKNTLVDCTDFQIFFIIKKNPCRSINE